MPWRSWLLANATRRPRRSRRWRRPPWPPSRPRELGHHRAEGPVELLVRRGGGLRKGPRRSARGPARGSVGWEEASAEGARGGELARRLADAGRSRARAPHTRRRRRLVGVLVPALHRARRSRLRSVPRGARGCSPARGDKHPTSRVYRGRGSSRPREGAVREPRWRLAARRATRSASLPASTPPGPARGSGDTLARRPDRAPRPRFYPSSIAVGPPTALTRHMSVRPRDSLFLTAFVF